MKTCVSTYSFGRYTDEYGILKIIDLAADMGYEGIEFVDGGWTDNLNPLVAKACLEKVRSRDLVPVDYCTWNDFLDTSSQTFEEKIQRLCRHVDFAAALGVSGMRHDVGWDPGKKTYDDVVDVMAEGCRRVTEYAKTKGIFTMTENHGFFSQDSSRVEKLYDRVSNDNFGLLVDIGNFMCADEKPEHAVGVTAKYAKHVHCKDFIFKKGTELNPGSGWFETRGGDYIRGTVLGHGVVPVCQCLRVLKKYGYDGFVSIEFEGLEDNLVALRLGLDYLKRCIEII